MVSKTVYGGRSIVLKGEFALLNTGHRCSHNELLADIEQTYRDLPWSAVIFE